MYRVQISDYFKKFALLTSIMFKTSYSDCLLFKRLCKEVCSPGVIELQHLFSVYFVTIYNAVKIPLSITIVKCLFFQVANGGGEKHVYRR